MLRCIQALIRASAGAILILGAARPLLMYNCEGAVERPEGAIRQGATANEQEAPELGLIEVVREALDDLLAQPEGRTMAAIERLLSPTIDRNEDHSG